MIFMVVTLGVADEYQEPWLAAAKDMTKATRAEPGTPWGDWYRIICIPSRFVAMTN